MSLLELLGTPAPIRTEYATRQHPDCTHPRKQVQCPRCHDWQDLTHNAHCTGCLIDLAYVIVPTPQQAAPAVVVTEEPAVIETAEPVASVAATEPAPLKPLKPEQKQYFVTWATSSTAASKKYALLCSRTSGLAVNCSCPDRVHRGRAAGRCCKHMRDHNAMLQPATQPAA